MGRLIKFDLSGSSHFIGKKEEESGNITYIYDKEFIARRNKKKALHLNFLAKKIGEIFQSKVISNRVKIVHSFLEFLEELSSVSSYDIVLTDLKLSDKSTTELCGYKIIRLIREKRVKIPIVVISGFSDMDRLRLAFEYGASDYIIKPIRLKELELRIINWFKNYLFCTSFKTSVSINKTYTASHNNNINSKSKIGHDNTSYKNERLFVFANYILQFFSHKCQL